MWFKAIAMLCLAALGGCGSVDVTTYEAEQPELRLEEYFNGTLDAWGMFQKRNGEVVKRFSVVIDASWRGNQGVLDERFSYSDGSKQRRVWRITNLGGGEYTGQAEDVLGTARGRVAGNALHWVYTLRLALDDDVHEVEFDDWMYLQEGGVLINRSVMKKFGFDLGEVILFFRKRS